MRRMSEHRIRRAALDNLAAMHYCNLVGEMAYYVEFVRNVEIAETKLELKFDQ